MKPYSKDLRLRVLAAVDRGRPRAAVAKTFGVSVPTMKKVKALLKKAAARTRETFIGEIGQAGLERFS